MTRFLCVLVLIGFASCLSGELQSGCTNPPGAPAEKKCINGFVNVCLCSSWCRWMATGRTCTSAPASAAIKDSESDSDDCSDSVDIPEGLSNLMESESTSCLFKSCNCIGRGNQIARRLASSFEQCDSMCRASFPTCKFWTFVPQYSSGGANWGSYCFFLTNCNHIKCGAPFNGFVSGPRICHQGGNDDRLVTTTPSFTFTNNFNKPVFGKIVFFTSQCNFKTITYDSSLTSLPIPIQPSCTFGQQPRLTIQTTGNFFPIICTPNPFIVNPNTPANLTIVQAANQNACEIQIIP